MNYLILSPQSTHMSWEFCERLALNGVNVIGIGQQPKEALSWEVRHVLEDYVFVEKLHHYEELLKACAYLTYRYGKICRIDAFCEANQFSAARLRCDFHVEGMRVEQLQLLQSNYHRRKLLREAGIRQLKMRRVLSCPQTDAACFYHVADKRLAATCLDNTETYGLMTACEAVIQWKALIDGEAIVHEQWCFPEGEDRLVVLDDARKKAMISVFAKLRLDVYFVQVLFVCKDNVLYGLDVDFLPQEAYLRSCEEMDLYGQWADHVCERCEAIPLW